MPAVLQPLSGGGNVVGCTFSLYFYQHAQAFKVFILPWSKWLKNLQTITLGIDFYLYCSTVFHRFNESPLSWSKSFFREFIAFWRVKLYHFPLRIRNRVFQRIECEFSSQRERCDNFRACDKRMRRRIRVVASGKIPIVRGNNGVLFPHLYIMPFPLSDAGAACVGENEPANIGQRLQLAIALDRRANLLAARSNGKFRFCFQSSSEGLLRDRCCSLDIFIRRIRAASD